MSWSSRSAPAYHVDTDKGFLYSSTDEAFVCQKKNHFQVTVHIGVATEPRYVRTPRGPQEVQHFLIKVFGIKVTPRTLDTRLSRPSLKLSVFADGVAEPPGDHRAVPARPQQETLPPRQVGPGPPPT